MGKKSQSLELQLAENQKIVESSDTELAELRIQMHILRERLAEVERTKFRAETLLYEARNSASRAQSAAESADESFAREPPGNQMPVPEPINTSPTPGHDSNWTWPSWLRRTWQITWKPKAIPDLLPIVAAGLLIISIAYLLPGDGPTRPRYTMATASPPTDVVDDEKLRASVNPAPRLLGPKAPKMSDIDIGNARKRVDPSGQVIAYKTRRVVSLREEPRYAAIAKSQIGAGTSISVLEAKGDWFKVQTRPSGDVGYVRREYLVRQSSTR